jgi:hypothetical protein
VAEVAWEISIPPNLEGLVTLGGWGLGLKRRPGTCASFGGAPPPAAGGAVILVSSALSQNMPTFRHSVWGYAVVALVSWQGMPRLRGLGVDISRLNTIVAFWRNFFCIYKDLYPLVLTRVLPASIKYTPLQAVVASHQFFGSIINVYLGVTTVITNRSERARIASWQEAASKLSDQVPIDARVAIEGELAREVKGCHAAEYAAACRFAIGLGFFYLASFGMKLVS